MIKKTQEEILESVIARMREETDVTDVDPGSIARAFCDVMSEQFALMYNELEVSATMSFVSTAKGYFLDLIGRMLNCLRLTGETDTNYRSRIVNQVYVAAGANLTSIRLKALSVEGVRNVLIQPYSHGAGSFCVYVIADNPETPQTILNAVEKVVNDTRAFGVFAEVKSPPLVPVELKVRLIFSDKASDAEKNSIRQAARQNIKSYIDNIELGGSFIVNELVQRTMAVSEKITDIEISSLRVKEISRFTTNFTVGPYERIYTTNLNVV